MAPPSQPRTSQGLRAGNLYVLGRRFTPLYDVAASMVLIVAHSVAVESSPVGELTRGRILHDHGILRLEHCELPNGTCFLRGVCATVLVSHGIWASRLVSSALNC